ncbi:MAG: methyltransferase domain-containing protein [Alphaproteobacteria bacterium]
MKGTRPIFVVGSGRSGTAALARVLGSVPGVEMHHEYLCTHIQPVSARYAMGRADVAEVRTVLDACHGAAIRLSSAGIWGDSSNKLSWIMPILAELYPDARYAHVVRDGRKVASSFFHKLADECYDDASVAALADWLDGRGVMPPPEKRYWWPLPQPGDSLHADFAGFDQFQRIAMHWAQVNAAVLAAEAALPAGMVARFRLEDLVAEEAELRRLFSFLGLPYHTGHFAALRRPHNVNRPEDTPLTEVQRGRFAELAGPMMARLGYGGRPEYAMDYSPAAAPAAPAEDDRCPLCGCADLRPAYRPRGTARDLTVHVCHGCGLVQSLPRQATAPKQPRVSGGADWGNVRYGKGFRLEDTMRRIGDRAPRRILDIGSNRGAFVEAAGRRWPQASITAIEPDQRVVGHYAAMPGLKLLVARIEDVALEEGAYDLIHCSHTLEHLADPVAALKVMATALAPGGVAYVEVPDLSTIGRADLVEEWFIDKHLYHFDAETLAIALAYAGLVPLRGIQAGLHLSAVVERGHWTGPLAAVDPATIAGRIAAYDAGLSGNERALRGAACRIAELAERSRVAVWGAGRILDSLVRIGGLDPSLLAAVVDRHLVRHADALHGARLLAPEALKDLAVDAIVIASREFADEIAGEASALAPRAEIIRYADLLTEERFLQVAQTKR